MDPTRTALCSKKLTFALHWCCLSVIPVLFGRRRSPDSMSNAEGIQFLVEHFFNSRQLASLILLNLFNDRVKGDYQQSSANSLAIIPNHVMMWTHGPRVLYTLKLWYFYCFDTNKLHTITDFIYAIYPPPPCAILGISRVQSAAVGVRGGGKRHWQ